MKAIYVRVSSEDQAERGYSIDDQIAECREKANTTDVIEYIDDGYSGGYIHRPKLTQLREDIREGLISEVICYDPDRLARKLVDQLIVSEEIEKRAKLTFVKHDYQKTPEGFLFYQMRGAIAEYEKEKINERMSAGRRRKALQGKVVKNPHIYGYTLNKKTDSLEIIETEATIVKMIFEFFTNPAHGFKGINGIALYLTENNIPTKKGKSVWHRQVVRQILMNEAYIGKFYHNRWNTEGILANKYLPREEHITAKERPKDEWIEIPCPQIISDGVFNTAQKMINESKRRWAKRSKNRYLLSGLLRCANCHNTMTGRSAKNWGKYVLEYTDYKNHAGAKSRGCGTNVVAADIEKLVWEQVKGLLENPDEYLISKEFKNTSFNLEEEEIIRLEKEIAASKDGIQRLLKAFALTADFSDDELKHALKELRSKEQTATAKLSELQTKLSEKNSAGHSVETFMKAADYYLNHGEKELSFENKQHLIRAVVQEIIINKDEVIIHTF